MTIFSTVLSPTAGLPSRSYGDFAGKEAAGERSGGPFTTLTPTAGLPGRRYGSFAGKSSGGAYTLVLEAGSYTITGADAAVKAGRKLTLEAGDYSVTGNDAALKAGRKLALDAGVYAITGADATLTYVQPGVYTLVCEGGVYTITGGDVSLTYSGAPPAPNRRTITPLGTRNIIPVSLRSQTRH